MVRSLPFATAILTSLLGWNLAQAVVTFSPEARKFYQIDGGTIFFDFQNGVWRERLNTGFSCAYSQILETTDYIEMSASDGSGMQYRLYADHYDFRRPPTLPAWSRAARGNWAAMTIPSPGPFPVPAVAPTLVAMVQNFRCERTTSGAGNDQVALAFAVLIAYQDDRGPAGFVAFGGYLLDNADTGAGKARGPFLKNPLFSLTNHYYDNPYPFEAARKGIRIRYIRVALIGWERDDGGIFGSVDTRGRNFYSSLGSGVNWADNEAILSANPGRVPSLLANRLKTVSRTDGADFLGMKEWLFTRDDLAYFVNNAALAPRRTDLETRLQEVVSMGPARGSLPFQFTGDGGRYTGNIALVRGPYSSFALFLPR